MDFRPPFVFTTTELGRGVVVDDVRDIFLSMRRALARTVSRIVPPQEVEDIVQETYVRLCQVGRLEHVRHPKSYLLRTARNIAIDSIKRAEYRLSDAWDENSHDPLGAADGTRDELFERAASSEEFGRFCEAVRQLPVQARRVFVLKKVYGYSQREIASELGLAQSTVEKHVALAMRRCAAYMAETEQTAAVAHSKEARHE